MDKYFEEAFREAREALDALEVPIGCCIVDKTTRSIISTGRNRTNELADATRHAEMEAIPKALSLVADLRHCALYVTIEPCLMCIAACRQVGLTDIWMAARNERFGGCGSVANAHTGSSMPLRA